MLTVLGAKPSPFVRKVLVALEEKSLEYELEALSPFPKTPELLALNPLGKIPVFRDGDLVFPDSSVIIAYLERTHPQPSLYPEDPGEFARALFLEEYADTKLNEAMGGVFFERFVKPNVFQQETDEARVAEVLENELPPIFDWLERQLEEGASSLVSRFSIADVGVGCQLGSYALTGEQLDAGRWPKLAAYGQQILSRPSFKAAMPG